jgi:hypothetical protein
MAVEGLLAAPDLDALLARRGLRDHTLGPTGARLFCSLLANAFGWQGRLCWVHDRPDQPALEDPFALRIWAGKAELTGQRSACMWYPSHALRQVKEAGLGVVERKFITADDVACDVVELTNHTGEPIAVRLEISPGGGLPWARTSRDGLSGMQTLYGQSVRLLLAAPVTRGAPVDRLVCEIVLAPGETTSLLIALAVGLGQTEALAALKRWVECEDPWAEHQRQYQGWYETQCPRFDCPDPRFVRLWWYRWFVVRHNHARPGFGHLPGHVFYEGKQGGYARLVTFSAPLILNEVRWLRDPAYCQDLIRALVESQPEEGLYRDLWADQRRGLEPGREGNPDPGYEEWLPAAMWQALAVHPAPEMLPALAESMARNVAGLRRLRDPNHNLLLNPGGHHMGQEHAPSFSYFADFADWYAYTELERVEYSAMFFASLQATAEIMAALGRKVDAQWHGGLAEKCRQAVLEKMWDEWDGFFYAIREADGEPARVKEANGLTPFTFGLVPSDPRYHRALEHLIDVRQGLWTTFPVASVAQDCPVFSPHPGYFGQQDHRPAATWSGAVWPYQVSLMVEALAEVLRRHEQTIITRARLMELMWMYAKLMSEGNDARKPMVREAHDAETGEGYGCPDYLHSSFNDLIIRHLAGLQPGPESTLTVEPLLAGWRYLRLEGIPYRGQQLDVIWESRVEGERYPDVEAGLTVRVEGVTVAHRPDLGPLQLAVPPLVPGE